MKNVIFIAPPASGKGTQSEALIDMGYEHISTGDMLRNEINKKSELGLQIEELIKNGNLVSDEIVARLISDRLNNLTKPFILDGYPRTYNQALYLDNIIKDKDYEVVYLDFDLDSAMKRSLGRLTCSCGASFNIYIDALKPKKEGICDKCGKVLIKRDDDNEESFKVRFDRFLSNIEPIKEFYKSKNRLHIVDATLDKDKITDIIKEILITE